MLLSDTYRLLDDDEKVIRGDQFKMAGLPDDQWGPVELFIGHRPREFKLQQFARVEFRRLIAREVIV
jgi:hypothetical protein